MSISPLRQRMIGDMTARHIGEGTQRKLHPLRQELCSVRGAASGDGDSGRLAAVPPSFGGEPAWRLQRKRVHDGAAVLFWDHARQDRPLEVPVPRL